MPQAAAVTIFPPEIARLIELVEGNLHYIVRMPMSREQAIELRSRLSVPIGTLASQNGLQPNGVHRIRQGERHIYIEVDMKTRSD